MWPVCCTLVKDSPSKHQTNITILGIQNYLMYIHSSFHCCLDRYKQSQKIVFDKGVYNEAATEICASMDQIGGVDEKSDKCP